MTDELYNKCIQFSKKNCFSSWYSVDVVHDLILEKGDTINELNYKGLILTAIRNFNISNGALCLTISGGHSKKVSTGICCKKCGDNLPNSEFRTTKNKHTGKIDTRNTCKQCENKQRNKRYHEKEKANIDYKHRLYLQQKEYKSKNKERKKIENRKYYLNKKSNKNSPPITT
jgi:hypothetical protein